MCFFFPNLIPRECLHWASQQNIFVTLCHSCLFPDVPILVFEIYLFLLVKFNYNAPVLLPVLLLFCMCQLLLYSVRMKRLREIHVKTEVCKSFDQPGDVGSSTHPHSPRTVGAWWGKRVRCPGQEQEMNFLVYAKLLFTYWTCLEGLPPNCSLILRLLLKPVLLLLWGDWGCTVVTASLPLAQPDQTSVRLFSSFQAPELRLAPSPTTAQSCCLLPLTSLPSSFSRVPASLLTPPYERPISVWFCDACRSKVWNIFSNAIIFEWSFSLLKSRFVISWQKRDLTLIL